MTDNNAALANNTPRPSRSDCQHDAVILTGLLDAINLLDDDGHRCAMTSVVSVALKMARKLADDLDNSNEATA